MDHSYHIGITSMRAWPTPQKGDARGFTIVELLVVISMISLLISLLMPALAISRRRARQIVCAASVHSIQQCVIQYSDDHQSFLPLHWADATTPNTWLHVMVDLYMNGDENVMRCPEHGSSYSATRSRVGSKKPNPSYGWNLRLGQYKSGVPQSEQIYHKANSVPNPSRTVGVGETEGMGVNGSRGYMLWEVANSYPFTIRHDQGGNAGYMDGHVLYQKQIDMVSVVSGDEAFYQFWPTYPYLWTVPGP